MKNVDSGAIWSALERAAAWAFRIRNSDNGWSALEDEVLPLWEGHMGSNPTDTAEMTLPLLELGLDRGEAPRAVTQVRDAVDHKSTLITRAPRQLMWPYMLLARAGDSTDKSRMQFELKVLQRFKEKGAGWSLVEGEKSNVYDTSITLRALKSTGSPETVEALSWFKQIQNQDGGWGFYKGDPSNPACTSHASVSLMTCGEPVESNVIRRAVEHIRRGQRGDGGWDTVMEKVPFISIHGYTHFSPPWCIAALMMVDMNANLQQINGGIEFLLRVQDAEGGWRAQPGGPRLVFATGNSMSTLGTYHRRVNKS